MCNIRKGMLILGVLAIVTIMAGTLFIATGAAAQGGGPGNGGRGGGGHDGGAWENCTGTEPDLGDAINAALIKLNAREAGGHNYILNEVIACGVNSETGEWAFRFQVTDTLLGLDTEKNVKVSL